MEDHTQISSSSEMNKIIEKVIEDNPKAVTDYLAGKKESLNFLLGQVMKASQKRIDSKNARDILVKKLV